MAAPTFNPCEAPRPTSGASGRRSNGPTDRRLYHDSSCCGGHSQSRHIWDRRHNRFAATSGLLWPALLPGHQNRIASAGRDFPCTERPARVDANRHGALRHAGRHQRHATASSRPVPHGRLHDGGMGADRSGCVPRIRLERGTLGPGPAELTIGAPTELSTARDTTMGAPVAGSREP